MTSGGRWPEDEDPEEERPWAVYGEDPVSSGPSQDLQRQGGQHSDGPYSGGPYSSGQHSGEQYSGNPYSGTPYSPTQNPSSAPWGQGGSLASSPYPGGSGSASLKDLPSRTAPILTIVGGALLALVVAPVILVSMVLQGIGFSVDTAEGLIATNGGQITVGDSGTVGLIDAAGASPGKCVLEGPGGTHETELELEGGVSVARGLTPGQYTVSCDQSLPGAQLMVLDGPALDAMVPSALKAMGISSIVGVAGVVAVIIGIIWLTKKNRKRREIFRGF